MDIARVKAEMLAHPQTYRNGFALLANFDEGRDHYQKLIMEAFGKDNIRCIQFIEGYIIVITLNTSDLRDYILVNLRENLFGVRWEPRYVVDSVFQVPAYIEILITDILMGLANAFVDVIKKAFSDHFTEITKMEISFVEWDGITTNGGDLKVKGITRDLEKTLMLIGQEKRVLFGKIEGRVTVEKFSPLKNLKDHVGNISFLWAKKQAKDEVPSMSQSSINGYTQHTQQSNFGAAGFSFSTPR